MLVSKLIIFFVYLHTAESFIEIDQTNKKLSTTIQKILCSTAANTIHLSTIDKGLFDDMDIVIKGLSRGECPVKTVLITSTSATNISAVTKHYHTKLIVLMVNSRESIHFFQQAVTLYQASNKHHRFLIIFQFLYELRSLRSTFKKLAQKTINNIVIVMNDGLEGFIVRRYNPFNERFILVSVEVITQRKEEIFVRNRSDLRGHNLIVSMIEQSDRAVLRTNGRPGYTGVDGQIADLLEERMTVTFTYSTPHEMYNGNKNSGVIGDLISGKADMSFNSDSLALFLVNETLDVTEPFDRNDMCILLPKAGDEPIIWNLLRTLSKLTWVITLFSLVAVMLIYRWTQNIQKQIYFRKYPFYVYSWTEVSTIIFQSFFGDAIKKIPKSMPLRMIIIGWCVYSFLITNAFQAKLISSLVRPRSLNDIETIEELGRSNLKIMYPKALADHIYECVDNNKMNVLRDQLVEVESWSEFDSAIAKKNQSTAFVMMRFHADLVEKRSFDKAAGRSFYHTMKQCLLTFPRVYFFKLGSMYVDYVSELLRRFHETGFIVKWEKHSDFINALHGNILVDEKELDDVDEANIKIVITVDHLQTSFYLLLVGLVSASLAFIGENIYFRWKQSWRKVG